MIELKELYDKTLEIFNAEYSDSLGERLMKACKQNDTGKMDAFTKLVNDLSIDWLQKIFQYYLADRKEKKQDYTPKSLARFVSLLSGDSDEVVDMCAGSGAIAIQKWNTNHDLKFKLYEIDENVIPFLSFNMVLRNISCEIYQADILSGEIYHEFHVNKGNEFGILKVIK